MTRRNIELMLLLIASPIVIVLFAAFLIMRIKNVK